MKKKLLGFSLIEISLAGVLFFLSLLLVLQWISKSSQLLFLNNEMLLQETQNFFANQILLPVSTNFPEQLVWQTDTNCRLNLARVQCIQYAIQFPNGKTFVWYKYENE